MNGYKVMPAETGDLDRIMDIFAQARKFMGELGNPQWQDGFPQKQFIADKIALGIMYKVMCEDDIAAVFSVLDSDEDYGDIDGAWLTEEGEYFVLHTVATAADYRGKGCARFIFSYAEVMAKERGKISVRMDTHEKNIPMRSLVASLGYKYCGSLTVRGGKQRIGFEKILKG